jgi:predicted lipoprotein
MGKKIIKYILLIAVLGLLAYNSVYLKKLDTKEIIAAANLGPVEVAQQFWIKQLPVYMDSAIDINLFLQVLKENPQQAFQKYSRTQGIGNSSFFLLKGEGVIDEVNEDEVTLIMKPAINEIKVALNTGIYFGNAVRDVTGKISMGDFTNTMDFNTVATELNKMVRKEVIMPFKANAVKGKVISFVGCAEINKEQVNTPAIQLLPVKIINQ